ncbi:MAG TPA: diadenylate cyclase CdaA [Clostridia bacterium]|jgi:diadenylate cyclase|nr:TIGR00159 family protein [Clostridiaceae bacterium]HOF27553.1 diadenylate cyclase CdaA [Clostridia bacterium]HOM35271.1 diadenylate cyclase CdaA [Clostridia bacterium]HOT71320.1 diadenylate cyclase CdaA [Clostridia bacterium]HPL08933.1 diadenylate cyclase CdaA [Clostridia bacterium]
MFNQIDWVEQIKYFSLELSSPLTVISAIIDIAIVSVLIYKLMIFVKEIRAWSLLKGVLVIVFVAIVSNLLGLQIMTFLFNNIITFAALSVVVLFQPELRKVLERLGTSEITHFFTNTGSEETLMITTVVDEIVKACESMADRYTGALIVIEKSTKIGEFINTGIQLNADVSKEILENIFVPKTPLHDGAVIIRKDKIVAAACLLPLTDNPNLSTELGMRHRGGLGITEVSDCIAVIVSEESGKISYASNGGLVRNLSPDSLRKALLMNLVREKKEKNRIGKIIRKGGKNVE